MANNNDTTRTTLVLSKQIKELIQSKAEENDRTLNGEIIQAIKFYLKYADTESRLKGASINLTAAAAEQEYIDKMSCTVDNNATISKEEETKTSIKGNFGF